MHNENYSIIFSSMTGNTRKLADKIHEILPKESCDYFGTADAQGIKSELLYIGFWTDKGNADSDTLDFLSKLKNKKIFLFGTAGFYDVAVTYGNRRIIVDGRLQKCTQIFQTVKMFPDSGGKLSL